MGITPISNLIPLQIARAIQADLEPLPMERVENSARTGDDTYSQSNGKPARGSKDGASEPDDSGDNLSSGAPGDQEDEPGSSLGGPPSGLSNSIPISFFA